MVGTILNFDSGWSALLCIGAIEPGKPIKSPDDFNRGIATVDNKLGLNLSNT